MRDTTVFRICVKGRLRDDWSDYFCAQSISVETDENGISSTTLTSQPVDQAGLLGIINLLNGMGLSVVSVERLPVPAENESDERETT
jgi:hypothetical protein